MKIQIIGYSGSGKSTLAKLLAAHYQINYLFLDNVHFYGDWQERTIEEQNEIVQTFLRANPTGWVIDGNYAKVAPERFIQADVTIFLDYNRFYCYRKCRSRYFENIGKSRESCRCVEKFDWEFKKWILWEGRRRPRKKRHLDNFNQGVGIKLRFKNVHQLSKYLYSHQIIKTI